jgi:plastocyanin
MRVRIVFAVALIAAACGGSDGGSTPVTPVSTNKAFDVYTLASAFSPTTLTISAGDTVRYNIAPVADGSGHDVTFQAKTGAPSSIPVTKTSAVIAKVFTTRGTFHYDCFVHPGMSGDVTVQ